MEIFSRKVKIGEEVDNSQTDTEISKKEPKSNLKLFYLK